MYTKQDYIKFIEETLPKFDKSNDERYKYSMFTIPTQWVHSNSIEDLIIKGIEMNKSQNGKSPIQYMMEGLK